VKRRWAAALVAALCVSTLVLATGAAAAWWRAERRPAVEVRPFAERHDAQAVLHGERVYRSRSCGRCHGDNAQGALFSDEGGFRLQGPALTGSPGSATEGYRSEDWARAVRHGLKRDGRAMLVMPSQDYNRLHDEDLASLVAFVTQLPAAANPLPARVELPWWLWLYYGFGGVKDAAAEIDHALPVQAPVERAPSAAHGRYLSAMCEPCHGRALQGGAIAGAPGEWPHAPPLRGPATAMGAYADFARFAAMMRTATRADGSSLAAMPAESYIAFEDVDLRALHAFLTQPAAPP
jgi:mono/diheme cytochrome c family protein